MDSSSPSTPGQVLPTKPGFGGAHPAIAPRRRACFVAWFLRPDRLWLGEFLNPEEYECSYVSSSMGVDIRSKRAKPGTWLNFFWLALKARAHLFAEPADIIITTFPQVAVMVALVNMMTFDRTPHVVWFFNCGHRYRGPRLWLSQLAFRHVSRFVVHSEVERKNYSEWFRLPIERFHFSFLTGARLDRSRYHGAREKFGLAERYVVALGSSSRDYKTLLDAMSQLDVQTVLVTHRYALQGLTIPDSVRILESIPQEDYLGVMAEAAVVVVPVNNVDTASGQMTLMQGLSLGVPVVATRCIGSEGYIIDGETGFLVEMGNVQQLRERVQSLLDSPELSARIAKAGLDFADEHFFDDAAAKVLATLDAELQRAL